MTSSASTSSNSSFPSTPVEDCPFDSPQHVNWDQLTSFTSDTSHNDTRMDAKLEDFKSWCAPVDYRPFDQVMNAATEELRYAFVDHSVYSQAPCGPLKNALMLMKTEEPWAPQDFARHATFLPSLSTIAPAQTAFAPSVFSGNQFQTISTPSSPFSLSADEMNCPSSRSPSESSSNPFSIAPSSQRHSSASSTSVFVKTEDIFSTNGFSRHAENDEVLSPVGHSSDCITDKKAGMSIRRSDRPLVIFWDPSSRRPVISTSSNLSTRFSHYQTVRFEPGSHYDVTPLATSKDDVEINGQQPKPWSGKGPGNFWLKAQVLPRRRCECGFSFLGGKEAEDFFKRPSVIREHIVSCKEWDVEEPLKKLCVLHRQADKTKQRTGRRNHASSKSIKRPTRTVS